MDPRASPLTHWFPPLLTEHAVWGMYPWQWLGLVVVAVVTPFLSTLMQAAALAVSSRLARLTTTTWDDELVTAGRGPTRLLAAAVVLWGATRPLVLRDTVETTIGVLARGAVIVSVGWGQV